MYKSEANYSVKDLNGEMFSLNPSAMITLFEIDVGDLALDKGLIDGITVSNEGDRILRFHSNVSLVNKNITWQNRVFTPAPIKAEGFEINARGVLPSPRLSLSVTTEGIPLLAILRGYMDSFGDLTGAKVTRIKTLLKYIDPINFVGNQNPTYDPIAEFPRDVFFIDRKSTENKYTIEFELASALDVEGVKLPARLIIGNRCVAKYRGEGCLYESENNRNVEIHGYPNQSTLPSNAPPVSNENDEKLSDLLGATVAIVPKGRWMRDTIYNIGEYVFVEKSGRNYYFTAKAAISQNIAPPNGLYWLSDICSKKMQGCNLRWGTDAKGVPAPGRLNGNPFNGALPINAFPATNKVR